MVLFFRVIKVLTVFISTVKADSYYPCKNYISFSYDDSNSLSSDVFRTQMNFIRNIIGNFEDPSRLRSEGAFTGEFNWNSGLTLAQMQSAIDNALQTSNQYSLLQQAASLATSVEILDTYEPVAALIFISDTSDEAIMNADRWLTRLDNIEITFVLLGTNVDSLKLRQFSKNFIYWPDLSETTPDNWDLLAYHAFECTSPCSTTLQPTSTLTPTLLPSTLYAIEVSYTSEADTNTVTSITIEPYIPCESWIFIGIDDSSHINLNEFQAQLNFISNVLGNITHAERVATSTAYNDDVSWNSEMTIEQIRNSVLSASQGPRYSLRTQFNNLIVNLQDTQTENTPVAALIFISDTSDAALAGAADIYGLIENIQITFVMLAGDVDMSKLSQFSTTYIWWPYLSQPEPDRWDLYPDYVFGCDPIAPPTATYHLEK